MSDYSPPPSPNAYDDLEDLLYDADPAPDLADELASHALHSPLLYAQDYEPGYELQEYFSDWEYYSDDYYDDDPAILKKHPIDGGSPQQRSKVDSTTRGRKRKLADIDLDNVVLKERRFLKDTLRGTVWATPIPVRNNIFQTGQGEKVALLKDWKERFGSTTLHVQPDKSRKPPKLPKDESWANDLSLADMGLLTERGNRTEQPVGQGAVEDDADAADNEEEEEPGPHQQINLDDIEIDEEAFEMIKAAAAQAARDGTLGDLDPQQLAMLQALTHRSRSRSATPNADAVDEPGPIEVPEMDDVPDSKPAKRRKKNTPTYKGALPTPPTSSAPTMAEKTTFQKPKIPAAAPNKRKREASASPPPLAAEPDLEEQDSNNVDMPGSPDAEISQQPAKKPKKTKPSALPTTTAAKARPKANATATGSTASSRAKRTVSTADDVAAKTNGKAEPAMVSGPARATRSRKGR